MGKRLNVPQPAVINTELAPFDESFEIDANGQLEQWYYDNSNEYKPNRAATALTLTPKLSVFDPDNNRTLVPSFYSVYWYALEYNGSAYVETLITNVDDVNNVDYVVSGNNLIVKKNVSYTRAVQIRCVATYIDPRDAGVTYTVEDIVTLSTNRDASVIFPILDIAAPPSQAFNPLVDDNSQFSLVAMADKGGVDVSNNLYYVWHALNGTTEVLANTMPWYVSGQNTKTLVVDALYGEDITVILRAKGSSSEASLYPSRAEVNIAWVVPDIETNVISENGGAVRANTEKMEFDVMVNVRHQKLSDKKINANLGFNWKFRKSTLSTENDAGWGRHVTLSADDVRNVYGSGSTLASTIVFPYVYLIGAFEEVTYNGAVVTHNGETVYARPVQ